MIRASEDPQQDWRGTNAQQRFDLIGLPMLLQPDKVYICPVGASLVAPRSKDVAWLVQWRQQ